MDEHPSSECSSEFELDVVSEEFAPESVKTPEEDESECESQDATIPKVVTEVV